jgi:hypothetical protein
MENLLMRIEFFAFSALILHSPRPGYPRSAVQSTMTRRFIPPSSFRRKPESRLLLTASWIPACAGMTENRLFQKVNLDKSGTARCTGPRAGSIPPTVDLKYLDSGGSSGPDPMFARFYIDSSLASPSKTTKLVLIMIG